MALIAIGVMWLAVAGMIAVVIRLQVPSPAELLSDVAGRRPMWIAANVVLIVQQSLFVLAVRGLTGRLGANANAAVRGLLATCGGALVSSGVFHGVLGAHLASKVSDGPLPTDLVLDAELVHALGDTFWFVGVGAMTAATAVASFSEWGRDRLLTWLGLGAVIANGLQFGWFIDHAFGVFAAPGTLLQAGWFAAAGIRVARDQDGLRVSGPDPRPSPG